MQKSINDFFPTEASKLLKIEEKLRNVCKIYNFLEIRTQLFQSIDFCKSNKLDYFTLGNGLAFNSNEIYSLLRFYLENDLHNENQVTKLYSFSKSLSDDREHEYLSCASISASSPFAISEMIALGVSIVKGFGLREYLVRINALSYTNIDAVTNCLDSMQIKYLLDDSLAINKEDELAFIIELEIAELGNQNIVVKGSKFNYLVNNQTVSGLAINVDLYKLLHAINLVGRKLIKESSIHAYFITDSYKTKMEATKVINVCRLGGLICEMDYLDRDYNTQLDIAYELNSLYTCILDDKQLEEFKITIVNNTDDTQESISIYDVYPYILNKLNKNAGGCANCREVKKDESSN